MTPTRDEWRARIWASDLATNPRMVALVYARFGENPASVWVVKKTGIQMAGMSRRTWERSVAVLVDLGWLTLIAGARGGRDKGRAAIYALSLPEGMDVTETRIPNNARHSDRNARHSDHNARHSGDLEQSERESKQQQRARDVSDHQQAALDEVEAMEPDERERFRRHIGEKRPGALTYRLAVDGDLASRLGDFKTAPRQPRSAWERSFDENGRPREWRERRRGAREQEYAHNLPEGWPT